MQLELSIIISQIVAFLVMLWILKKFAWKPFLKLQSDRRAKIQEDFEALELQKTELEKLMQDYKSKLGQIDEEARKAYKEALDRAEKMAKNVSQEAHAQAKALIEKAKLTIQQEIAQAEQGLKTRLVDLVIETSEKLIHEKIEPETDRKQVAAWVEKVHL